MDYFENELQQIADIVTIPLMQKRLEHHLEDPMEELVEVYSSVKDIEQSLLKACNIGKFIIGKNKEMFQANIELQEELEEIDLER